MLEFEPPELAFHDVVLNKTYIQKITVTNTLKATVEVTLRPGSAERYSVCPSDILLKPGESIPVEVKLRITRYAHKQRATEMGQRDVFHVKTPYFDQKFTSTFFLSADDGKLSVDRLTATGSPAKPSRTPTTEKRPKSALSASVPELSMQGPGLGSSTATRNLHRSVSFSALPTSPGVAETMKVSATIPAPRPQTGQPDPDEQSSELLAFESFRAQMEADRSEVHQQLERLGLSVRQHTQSQADPPAVQRASTPSQATDDVSLPTQAVYRRTHSPEPHTKYAGTNQQECDHLRAANQHLSAQVDDLGAQLASCHKELKSMMKVQTELQARQPDVERLVAGAVQREHAVQEERNRKALELLLKKDEHIKKLEVQNGDLQTDACRLQDSLRSALSKLKAAETSASQLLHTNEQLKSQLDREAAAAASGQASLLSEVAEFNARLADASELRKQCKLLQERLDEGERHQKELQADLQAAEQANLSAEQQIYQLNNKLVTCEKHIQDLEETASQHAANLEKQKAAYMKQVSDLQEHVKGLQDTLNAVFTPGSGIEAGAGQAPAALFDRIRALEEANSRLEELLSSESSAKVERYELQCTKDALSRRDQEVALLQAELAVLRASNAERPNQQEPSTTEGGADNFRIRMLTEQVQAQNALISELQDKLAHLEAVHAVAQESAVQSEHELQHARALLSEMEEVGQKYAADAEAARQTAVKLNSRITELMLSEQAAQAESATTRQDMLRQHELHKREMHAMENHMQRQHQQLHAAETAAIRSKPDGGFTGVMMPSSFITQQELQHRKAVEDVEDAIGVLQAQLAEANRLKEAAWAELDLVKREADDMRRSLEHQVKLARQDGSTKIQSLEDTIRRMSSRGGLQAEVADLGNQLGNAKRSEKRLAADLDLTEQQIYEQKEKIAKLEYQLRAVSKQLEDQEHLSNPGAPRSPEAIHHRLTKAFAQDDTRKQQELIAKLASRAEAAESDAERLKGRIRELQLAVERTPLTLSAANPGEVVVALQSELRVLREQKEVICLEAEQLRQQLLEASREVAAAHGQLAAREDALREKEEAALRKSLQAVSAHAQEVAAANRKAAEARRHADQADNARIAAEEQARQATVWLAKLKAELEAKNMEAKRIQEQSEKDIATSKAASAASKREYEKAAQEAEERKIQASILMDTVETLQVGNSGEAAQRVLALTAQLVTARTREVMLERRAAELLAEVEARDKEVNKLHNQIDAVLHETAEKEAELAASNASLDNVRQNVNSLTADLHSRNSIAQTAMTELDEAKHVLVATQAELEGLKAAMLSAQARHREQLTRERAESSKAVNMAKEQAMMLGVSTGDDVIAMHTMKLADSVDALLSWVVQQTSWSQSDMAVALIQRMKAILLEADQHRAKGEVDARLARAEAAGLSHRLAVTEAALDRRTSEWETAKLQYQLLQKSLKKKGMLGAAHAEELASLQEQRIISLSKQLTDATKQLSKACTSEAALKSKLASHKARASALQKHLRVSEAEVKELLARLAAAQLEVDGLPDEAGDGAGDRSNKLETALYSYVDEHLVALTKADDSKDQLKSLVGEVCALKIVESQLLAKLAATTKRADAAMMLSQALQQAADAATEQLEASQAGQASGSDSALELSQLTAMVAAKSQEIQRLQEQLLLSRQHAEAKELQLREAEAQLNAASFPSQAEGTAKASEQTVEARATAVLVREKAELIEHVQQLRQLGSELKQAARRDAEKHAEEMKYQRQQAQEHTNAAVDSAVRAVLENHAPKSEVLKAETHSVQMEALNQRLQQENEILQQKIKSLEVQLADLKDVEEVTHSAMTNLENTLARIERFAVVSTQSGVRTRSPVPTGPRRTLSTGRKAGASSSESEAGEMSLASLSQELVKARLAQAEAQRKLRVASRSEVELRQRLVQRDERITQLKEELEARNRIGEDLRRRLPSSGPATPRRKELTSNGSTSGRLPAESGAVKGADADVEKGYLTSQVAQMRIQLAGCEAEIERLEGALAAAQAVQREPPDVKRLSKKVAKAEQLGAQMTSIQAQLQAAISTGAAAIKLLGPPSGADNSDTAQPDEMNMPDQQGIAGQGPGAEAAQATIRLAGLMVELASRARECAAELRGLRALQSAASQVTMQGDLLQSRMEQLMSEKQQLQTLCSRLQSKLDAAERRLRHSGEASAAQAPAVPTTALGLCKMLDQNLKAMRAACSTASSAPPAPSIQVLLSEMDGASSLVSSLANELAACCKPPGSEPATTAAAAATASTDMPFAEPSFSFNARQPAVQQLPADVSQLQDALREQQQLADKWQAQCVQMRTELAALQASLATQPGLSAAAAANVQDLLEELRAPSGPLAPELVSQMTTQLQAARATAANLQKELTATQAALGQEQRERAQSLASMRTALAGLATYGPTEERLKVELIRALEAGAEANSSLAKAQARLDMYQADASAAREELQKRDLQSASLLAQLRTDNVLMLEKVEEAEARAFGLERSLTSKLDAMASLLQHMEAGAPEHLASGLEDVQRAAEALGQEMVQLQANLPSISKAQLQAVLLKCRKYQQGAKDLQAQVASLTAAADQERQRLQAELENAQRAETAQKEEVGLLQQKLVDMQAFSESERQRMVERHVAQLREVETRMEAERRELRQQANARAEAAMAAGESRALAGANARVAEMEAQASHSVAAIEEERARCAMELASLQLEFKRYQQQKAAEINAMEQRLVACLALPVQVPAEPRLPSPGLAAGRSSAIPNKNKGAKALKKKPKPGALPANRQPLVLSSPPHYHPADLAAAVDQRLGSPSGDVAAARESEMVEAARREAHIERLHRTRMEAVAEQLQQEVERLKGKLRSTQQELRQVQEASSAASRLSVENAQLKEECQRLQEELGATREALKAARADSSRRQRLLQQFQTRQGHDGTEQYPATFVEAHKVKLEAAETQLLQARNALDRKTTLIKDLRRQLDELRQQLEDGASAALQDKMAVAEARIAQLQAALQRKEAALKQAKDQAEQQQQLTSAAVATTAAVGQQAAKTQEAQEEAERQARMLARLRAEVQRKDALLKSAQNELEQEKQKLQSALTAAEEAAKKESRAAKQAANDVATLKGRLEHLVEAVRSVVRLVLRCCEAMQAAASSTVSLAAVAAAAAVSKRQATSGRPKMGGVGHDDIAKMVDMSAAEVADLLGGAHSAGTAVSQEAVRNMAGKALALIAQIEAALPSGLATKDVVPGRDNFARLSNSALGLQQKWDGGATGMLLQHLEASVQMVQTSLEVAVEQLPAAA